MSRPDRILGRLIRAEAADDRRTVESLTRELVSAHPELCDWAAFVLAGCRSAAGRPAVGRRLLAMADARGAWWAPSLLADPALDAIWPLDTTGIRARSARRWQTAQETAMVTWRTRPGRTPVLVSLHGNGPAPVDPLVELTDYHIVSMRSSQSDTASVGVWRDRDRALTDLQTVLPREPAVLVGLGAGGRVAIDAALSGMPGVAGAVAVAPQLGNLVRPAVPAPTRICILSGGSPGAVRSCEAFAAWAAAHGVTCTVRYEEGMGHAYPVDLSGSLDNALEATLARRPGRR